MTNKLKEAHDVIMGMKPASRSEPNIKLSGEYFSDCQLLMGRIETLEWALKDAKSFAAWVECLGRTECEIYKHELKASADLSLERIDKALGE